MHTTYIVTAILSDDAVLLDDKHVLHQKSRWFEFKNAKNIESHRVAVIDEEINKTIIDALNDKHTHKHFDSWKLWTKKYHINEYITLDFLS